MPLYWALRAAFFIARYVPPSWLYRCGMLGGEAVYWCWPAKRRNTCRNMAVVSGDWRQGRRAAALARASWRHYGRYIMDFLRLPTLSQAEIVRRTRVQGWEHLDRALEAGKGVIFVTGHFGVWDYAPTTVADRYPGRVHVVAETFNSARLDRLIQSQRAALGATVIPMTNVRQMIRVLRHNDILALLVDRPAHGEGVPVRFFGHNTTVPAGAATLAAMTGAALIPGYLFHRDDGDYDGGILPVIEPSRSGDRATDVRRMTQGIFSALERIITPRPHNWYMFRDLWPAPLAMPAEAETELGAPA